MFDFELMVSMLPALTNGALLTLQLTATIIAFGTLLSLPIALAKNAELVWCRGAAQGYIMFFRGTPSLVQVFLLYFGAGQFPAIQESFLWPVLRDPFWCVVIALSLNTAAYTGKTLAAALVAIPKGVKEACFSLGLSRAQAFWTVDLRLAFRSALPAFGNDIIMTCKATALASTVTLMELTGAARLISSETYAPFEAFLSAGLMYLVINHSLTFVVRHVERHYARAS